MIYHNCAYLMGVIIREPILREGGEDGQDSCKFTISILHGSGKNNTIPVIAFGDQARFIASNSNIGTRIFIRGVLSKHQWKTESGEKYSAINVVIKEFTIIPKADINMPEGDYEEEGEDDYEVEKYEREINL